MSDTNLTPGVGSLSLSGKFGLPQLPPFQTNGTDVTAGARLPPFQLNGTDVSGGARLPPYQLPGASVTRVPGVGALSFTGQNPTFIDSGHPNYVVQPSTGSFALTGFAPTITVQQIPQTITVTVGSLALAGFAPALSTSSNINLLLRTLISFGASGADAAFTLPLRTLDATGTNAVAGEIAFTVPLRTLVTTGQDGAAFHTPLRTLAATGVVGVMGNAAFDVPTRTLAAAGSPALVGTASFSLLLRALASTAAPSIAASIAFTTPLRRLLSGAIPGVGATAAFRLPLRTLSAYGNPALIGNVAFTVPLRYLSATGYPAVSSNYRTWVMNVRTGSLVEYDNFLFDSLTKFGENYLASGPNGLFVLGGDDDNGAAINSTLRTGLDSFGDSMLKRIPRIYHSGSQEGDLFFATISTEDGRRTYSLIDNGIRGEQQRRVPVGRGPKSVRWQFEIKNRNGCNFGTSEILIYPQVLRRRVQ